MRTLRLDQSNGIDTIARKYLSGIRSLIFQLATGGGKTVTFAGLTHRFLSKQQRKVLILVHREELLAQARKTIFEWYDIVAAPVTAGSTYLPNVMVYIAMVETANNRLKKNPKYFGNIGMLIVDEVHIGSFNKIYDYFPDALRVGFTATAVSANKREPLKKNFQDIVCGIDIPELISIGALVPNITHDFKNINRKELKVKNGEFDDSQMSAIYSDTRHVQNCVAAYRTIANHTKAIIFNVNIEHSKKVQQAFESFGYPCRHLDGESPDHWRKATLKWFHETPNAILCNVGVLTTGFDEPSVQTVVVNKSTKSIPLWLQMTGRGSRPYPGKKRFNIIDMGDNASELGDWCAVRNWSDIFWNPEKARDGSGEAPSKACVGCRVIIHASTKLCPHCGATNSKVVNYDRPLISLDKLMTNRPINIDVAAIIREKEGMKKADGTPFKELSVIHTIKAKLITHVQRVWKIKRIDDRLAARLQEIFLEKILEWSALKNREPDKWLLKTSRDWLQAEFLRVFKYEPPISNQEKRSA